MIRYTTICLRDGVKCFERTSVLTHDELVDQFIFWNVQTLGKLLQAWNRQPESKATKLKWFYF
jgi:hypothetical protein